MEDRDNFKTKIFKIGIPHQELFGHMGILWEILMEKLLLRSTRRWKNIIKIDLVGIGWEGVDWIQLVQDRENWRVVLKTAMKIRVV